MQRRRIEAAPTCALEKLPADLAGTVCSFLCTRDHFRLAAASTILLGVSKMRISWSHIICPPMMLGRFKDARPSMLSVCGDPSQIMMQTALSDLDILRVMLPHLRGLQIPLTANTVRHLVATPTPILSHCILVSGPIGIPGSAAFAGDVWTQELTDRLLRNPKMRLEIGGMRGSDLSTASKHPRFKDLPICAANYVLIPTEDTTDLVQAIQTLSTVRSLESLEISGENCLDMLGGAQNADAALALLATLPVLRCLNLGPIIISHNGIKALAKLPLVSFSIMIDIPHAVINDESITAMMPWRLRELSLGQRRATACARHNYIDVSQEMARAFWQSQQCLEKLSLIGCQGTLLREGLEFLPNPHLLCELTLVDDVIDGRACSGHQTVGEVLIQNSGNIIPQLKLMTSLTKCNLRGQAETSLSMCCLMSVLAAMPMLTTIELSMSIEAASDAYLGSSGINSIKRMLKVLKKKPGLTLLRSDKGFPLV